MDTESLIARLASETRPVSRHARPLRLGLALATGLGASLVLIASTLGFRPDLDLAMAGPMFWMKLAYTGSLALIAIVALLVLIRPEARPPQGRLRRPSRGVASAQTGARPASMRFRWEERRRR